MMVMLMCWCGSTRMIHGQVPGDRRLDTTPVADDRSVAFSSSQSASDAVFVTEQSHQLTTVLIHHRRYRHHCHYRKICSVPISK